MLVLIPLKAQQEMETPADEETDWKPFASSEFWLWARLSEQCRQTHLWLIQVIATLFSNLRCYQVTFYGDCMCQQPLLRSVYQPANQRDTPKCPVMRKISNILGCRCYCSRLSL